MEILTRYIILLLPEWEFFWCRIILLLMLFGLLPLLTIEGIKVKLEEKEKEIDMKIEMYLMGELQ